MQRALPSDLWGHVLLYCGHSVLSPWAGVQLLRVCRATRRAVLRTWTAGHGPLWFASRMEHSLHGRMPEWLYGDGRVADVLLDVASKYRRTNMCLNAVANADRAAFACLLPTLFPLCSLTRQLLLRIRTPAFMELALELTAADGSDEAVFALTQAYAKFAHSRADLAALVRPLLSEETRAVIDDIGAFQLHFPQPLSPCDLRVAMRIVAIGDIEHAVPNLLDIIGDSEPLLTLFNLTLTQHRAERCMVPFVQAFDALDLGMLDWLSVGSLIRILDTLPLARWQVQHMYECAGVRTNSAKRAAVMDWIFRRGAGDLVAAQLPLFCVEGTVCSMAGCDFFPYCSLDTLNDHYKGQLLLDLLQHSSPALVTLATEHPDFVRLALGHLQAAPTAAWHLAYRLDLVESMLASPGAATRFPAAVKALCALQPLNRRWRRALSRIVDC